MPITGVIQPEILQITDTLRLRKYDGRYETFLSGYQDPVVYQNSEGIFEDSRIPDLSYMQRMCTYLDKNGELYYIEVLTDRGYEAVGDVTAKPENPPVAIWKEACRGRGIGFLVMKAVIQRLKALGYEKIIGSSVYTWNRESQKLHRKLGFRCVGREKDSWIYELDLVNWKEQSALQLSTARLYLREPGLEDAEEYLQIRNSEYVLRYNAMLPITAEKARRELSGIGEPGSVFAMEQKDSGKLVGMIYVGEDSLRYGVDSRELSYFLDESFSRQGYMKEALKAVTDWLFETQELDCICARSFAPNAASRALLRSLGFTENGVIPGCVKGYGGIIYDDVIYTLFP